MQAGKGNVPLSVPVVMESASKFAEALGEDFALNHMGLTHNEMATYHKNGLFFIPKLKFWSLQLRSRALSDTKCKFFLHRSE